MSTRNELLKTLDGITGKLLSGEVLARHLGISRTGVWKHLHSMKMAGLPLEGTGRRGYRLVAPMDNSLAMWQGKGWIVPHYFLSTASTQGLAKGGAASGLPEGHLWMAETQTVGKGRLERRWDSSYGGLWFSLLLRPRMAAARVPPLTLLAGLSLCEAVEKVTGVDARLKWPNDLVVGSQKVAGILTEMSGQMDRTDWVILGIGLNVNNTLPSHLSRRATTLYALTGRSWSRGEILREFLGNFRMSYARFLKEGFEPFRRKYWLRYFAPREKTCLQTGQGALVGTACGVDASGAIMIKSHRKIRKILEGEIVL